MAQHWIDWIIVLVIFYFLYRGWEAGLLYLIADLFALAASFWLALHTHGVIGQFLMEKFGVAASWKNIVGYVVVWVASQVALSEILKYVAHKIPLSIERSFANRFFGALVSGINGVLLISFFLLLILVLPLRGTVKNDIGQSYIGKSIVSYTETHGGKIKQFLSEATREAVKFLTIQPGSKERLILDITRPEKLTVDESAERRMVDFVNQERAQAGIGLLRADSAITAVARKHSEDMFKRLYFSHINPEGQSAGERLSGSGVSYGLAGENLAYAPDVLTAHNGLMDSVGHRENILDPRFRRIGIGVIDGGIWGQMYTQNFTD